MRQPTTAHPTPIPARTATPPTTSPRSSVQTVVRRVYGFCTRTTHTSGTSRQYWCALAEDGTVVTTHASPSLACGSFDVGPTGLHRGEWQEAFGDQVDEIAYIVLPPGAEPPGVVRQRYAARYGQAVPR